MFRNLTDSGKKYLATRLANNLPVKFSKVKIGSGAIPNKMNPSEIIELIDFKKEVKIFNKKQENNSLKITLQITNKNIKEGFYLKEIGIFVDDDGEDVLYWYANEDNAQYINAETDVPIAFEIDILMEVTNKDSVVINWDGEDLWINRNQLEKYFDEFEKKSVKRLEEWLGVKQSKTTLGRGNLGNFNLSDN